MPPLSLSPTSLDLTSTLTEVFLPRRIYGTLHPLSEITVSCTEGKVVAINPVTQVLTHEGPPRTSEWREATIEIRIKKSQSQVNRELIGLIVALNVVTAGVWYVGVWECVQLLQAFILWFLQLVGLGEPV